MTQLSTDQTVLADASVRAPRVGTPAARIHVPAARGAAIAGGVIRSRALINLAARAQPGMRAWADPHRDAPWGAADLIADLEQMRPAVLPPMRRWLGDWTWDDAATHWFHPDPIPAIGRIIATHAACNLTERGDGTPWGREYAVHLQLEALERCAQLGRQFAIQHTMAHGQLLGLCEALNNILDSTAYPDQVAPTRLARNSHWFARAQRPHIDLAGGDAGSWTPAPAEICQSQRRGLDVTAVRIGADCLGVRSWFPGGQVAETYTTWCANLHGEHRRWHGNGQARSIDRWMRGVRHGESQSWDDTGRLLTRTNWAFGRLHGACELTAGDGCVERGDYAGGYRTGRWVTCDPTGRVIEQGPYEAGLRSGDWTIAGRHVRYAEARVTEEQLSLW